MSEDSQLKLRIPRELKEKIEAQSKKNRRTINGEVTFLLEESLHGEKITLEAGTMQMLKDLAEKSNRSINDELWKIIHDSYLYDNLQTHTDEIRQHFSDVKIYNIGNGINRVVYGKMLDVFNIDYSKGSLSDIQKILISTIETIKKSPTLKQRFQFFNKNILIHKGGHHIDIVDDGVGSLNWLMVEDHLTDFDKLGEY